MTQKQQFKQNTTDMYAADNKKALKPLQEYPLGNHVILEVVESDSCQGCFFSNGNKSCTNPIMACSCDERADGKNVVFLERSFVREYEKKESHLIMDNYENYPEVFSRMKYIQDEKAKKIAEFILDYAFVDDKEIYTNGTILVPVFRVLDALSMINQKEIKYSSN